MTGSDLPILVALVLVTGYFLYKRHRTLFIDRGYLLIGAGLCILTLTMLVDWLTLGIDRVFDMGWDPDISTTTIAYLGFVPGILLIGFGLTRLLPRLDRVAQEIEARRAAEVAAKDRARDLLVAKREAEAANVAKSKFLASMTHELRTPLNAIIGFSDMMRQEVNGPLGDPRYVAYANDIEHSGRHLLAIINDILDMSKIEAGAERLTESEVLLGVVVDTAVRLVQGEYDRYDVRLEVDSHLDHCLVRLDQVKVSRVLINLLSNAMKFTERDGEVTLRSRLDPTGALILTVRDNGIGMDPDEIDVALTPFGQARAIDSRDHQGTGLGLPIAKALIELHDGRFAIDSRVGEGTTVTLQLPADRVINCPHPNWQAAGD